MVSLSGSAEDRNLITAQILKEQDAAHALRRADDSANRIRVNGKMNIHFSGRCANKLPAVLLIDDYISALRAEGSARVRPPPCCFLSRSLSRGHYHPTNCFPPLRPLQGAS